jgi:phosphoribosyl 1,2-cyclic phosphodiesterase
MSEAELRVGVTVLGSGSRGNAIAIHTPTEGILIDAGFSARDMAKRLSEVGIDGKLLKGILVSHEHADHVRGLSACARKYGLPVYSNRRTADVLRSRNGHPGSMHIFAAGSAFSIGSFHVEPFSIPHDANDPVGFAVRIGVHKVGIATDLGHVSHLVCHQLQECDILIVESNHDIGLLHQSSRPWALKQRIMGRHGHLSNSATLELLERVVTTRTQHLVLAHASQECNTYDLVERSAADFLRSLGREDIRPMVARQDEPLPTLWL